MEKNIITVGWYKGNMDFGVNCAIEDLTYEEMKSLREMLCVAIGQAEQMWAKGHNRKHPATTNITSVTGE